MMRKITNVLITFLFLVFVAQSVYSVTHEELGRMLLGSNYGGITQEYDVFFDGGPTSATTYGGWHPGIDYKARSPLPIYSPMDGVVDSYDPEGTGYGRVSIRIHGTNDYFIFLHLSKVSVKKDQKIKVGDPIGMTGSTGAPAPHLHVEVRTGRSNAAFYFPSASKTGVNKDPSSIIPSDGSPSSDKNLKYYTHIDSQYRTVLRLWLDTRSGWRPAVIDDDLDATSPDQRPFVLDNIKSEGPNFHPFYVAADFNGDGRTDFAVICTTNDRSNWAVAIFNAPFGKTPTFYTEKLGRGDWLFWKANDGFGKRFIIGVPESDSGYIVRPRGNRYVVE